MNTARQLLWLPTQPRGEVQGEAGDRHLLRARRRRALGGGGLPRRQRAAPDVQQFALVNIALTLVWIGVALTILQARGRVGAAALPFRPMCAPPRPSCCSRDRRRRRSAQDDAAKRSWPPSKPRRRRSCIPTNRPRSSSASRRSSSCRVDAVQTRADLSVHRQHDRRRRPRGRPRRTAPGSAIPAASTRTRPGR